CCTLSCSLAVLASSSPTFPYTTLFRSHAARISGEGDCPRVRLWRLALTRTLRLASASTSPRERGEVKKIIGRPRDARNHHVLQEDRNSTRLNSSHVKISYAVFCLKKKN